MLLTVADFVARIGEVEADNVAGTGPRGARVLDEMKISTALTFAAQLITAKISARYPVIPADASEMIAAFAVDIALYRLRYKVGDQSGVQDETLRRYKIALDELEKIGVGKTILPGAVDTSGAAPANALTVFAIGDEPRAPKILDGYFT